MVDQEGAVYCTLLLSDNYLPGAVVLAHSLRDNGSKAKLVALYTPDTLQAATINELQAVYDELIPVYRMTNHKPANLWLMERPDLIATFTKIELWRQTQYKRIVYIDSDVVSIRAPDELLELDVDFAAVPDVGWPDCFNSGVMVLRPNMQDYFSLKALAERGTSFDGADQGLLNMHFKDWHRLSFTYNCTPSANYQYVPAYKHFKSTISLVHFIGFQKPWNMSRQVAPFDSPYNQLLGRWWTIYDRHYQAAVEPLPPKYQQTTPQVHYPSEYTFDAHTEPTSSIPIVLSHYDQSSQSEPSSNPQPEHNAREDVSSHPSEPGGLQLAEEQPSYHHVEHHNGQLFHEPIISAVPQYVRGEEHVRAYIPQQPHRENSHHFAHDYPVQQHIVPPQTAHPSDPNDFKAQLQAPIEPPHAPTPPQEEPIFEAPKAEWDASREPPPLHSKPEGIALETKTYTMSDDHQLFQPPASYPEAPKNMWYPVPEIKPEPQKLAQLFPWETNAPKPTRVFVDEERTPLPVASPASTKDDSRTSQSSRPTSWTSDALSLPSESWDSYSRSNAWDEVPEIQQYIQSIQQARKARVQVLSGGPSQTEPTSSPTPTQQTTTGTTSSGPNSQSKPNPNLTVGTGSGTLITDFPSEVERPSLPVTPAPIQRGPAIGSPDEYTSPQLPAAKGVPSQEEWNPSVRLEELRWRQNSVWSVGRVIEERTDTDENEAGEGDGVRGEEG